MSSRLQEALARNTMEAAPALVRGEADKTVQCLACGNRCRIPDGESGICRMRTNHNGVLRVPHGYVAGLQVDPIEKKPFFHAFPGRNALSFGMMGCNLHCSFCQNWISSQALRDVGAGTTPRFCTADSLVETALRQKAPAIVSTYNEPLITSDWAMTIFEKAREKGLVCGYVSNGNATPEVLEFIRPCVDLYKVDLKCFDEEHYLTLGCTLQNVLDTIEQLRTMGFWVEIVTLVVPGFNDSPEELQRIAEFIAGVSCDIPWHVTAFHPDYRETTKPRTAPIQLERAYAIGKEAGLHFVYAGNLSGAVGTCENTYCPSCEALLIERQGFFILENRMKGRHCPNCNAEIPGVWEDDPPRRSEGGGMPRQVKV